MFLTVLCLSLVGVLVSAALFAAAMPRETETNATMEGLQTAERQQFFVEPVRRSAPGPRPQVPVEVLLLQIERHVRLEQAAAESFHLCPTAEALHMHTVSPLVH
jgi:hypothetical protein